MSSNASLSPAHAVARCQTVLAHAWMVRTFVKHSPEVEQFPELLEIVRNVFDLSRALETRVEDPPAYLQMLKKKIGKLRKAAEKFRHDAPLASTHTNFQQAVLSMDACVAALDEVLAAFPPVTPPGGTNVGPAADSKRVAAVVAEQEDQAE
jgi:hypothetical protein